MSKNFEQVIQRPNAASSTKWLVGNSQMAKFSGALGHFQIRYKRGGKIEEIMAETERLVTSNKATHVIVDGFQNSVRDIRSGILNLEVDILPRLKFLNKKAKVVLSEVLYCPEHQEYVNTLHMINRQIRRMNREASGMETPRPWKALNAIYQNRNRKQAYTVTQFPDAFTKDGYHINVAKIIDYEAELAACMAAMVAGTKQK